MLSKICAIVDLQGVFFIPCAACATICHINPRVGERHPRFGCGLGQHTKPIIESAVLGKTCFCSDCVQSWLKFNTPVVWFHCPSPVGRTPPPCWVGLQIRAQSRSERINVHKYTPYIHKYCSTNTRLLFLCTARNAHQTVTAMVACVVCPAL